MQEINLDKKSIMNKKYKKYIGMKIRRLRKKNGLKTRDSSIGYKDLLKYWANQFASIFKYRMNYTSLARQVIQVQKLSDETPFIYGKDKIYITEN